MLRFARVTLPACVAVLCACTGTIGPEEGDAPAAAVGGQPGAAGAPDLAGDSITSPAARAACGDQAPDPGPSAIRRLTRREYNNGVRDLLGDTSEPASAWLAEPGEASFDNNAVVQAISRQHVEQFRSTAIATAV